ncbi:NAD(P)/FAD-dependent oxidoreductase [Roseibium sp. RKSG952]|uniref:flavin monoamine oxidase family protein n=1 Tax=Roseibium sp. RKSG952 TaxID=2529384 RepID=UPI0012BD37E5|nr:NAD(P)/FAD-dependent oxidoreductase [Roseibium sp. RKSG952]MTI03387.1 FAD-dependent oxidoreductase [Roseibium sp. RKSG952]
MYTRRSALKLGIASFLVSLGSGVQSQDLDDTTVIVIGAGISGLAAGQELLRHGAKVIILEAGDYAGGRIRTDMSMGVPFEYGAGWIHGPSSANPIQKLATQIKAPTFLTDDNSLEVFGPDGTQLTDAEYQHIDDTYERLLRKLYLRVWNRDTRSIKEAIADLEPEVLNDPLGRWLLSAFVEFDIGAGIEDISAANAFADTAFEGDDVIFTEGYDTILAPLMSGLDIRLSTPVNRIAYGDDGVIVNGIPADYAICSVPLGVLKTNDIEFDPPLPTDLQVAIEKLGFGSVTKIALRFDKAFWDEKTQYFGIVTEPKGRWNYWLNYRTFSEENVLLGLSFGSYAPIADRMSQSEMTEDALAVLRAVWGEHVDEPNTVLSTHWSEYTNFRGAYSYPQTGGSTEQFEVFGEPVAERLFFAGEHTIFDYHSTTHGAFLSGRHAATRIIEN